jgi:hypothetical protein
MQSGPAMTQSNVRSALDSLITARDEVRVRLHLASLDAKELWDELEAKIVALQGRVGDQAEKITDDVADTTRELSDSVKKFVDEHLNAARG